MPFEKGHKLSTGRPKGSKNKSTDVDKEKIQELLFDFESIQKEWQQLDVHKKFDIRMKAMPYFYSRPQVDIGIDATDVKPWGNQKMIRLTAPGEEEKEVEDWEKAALWEFHGGNLPLFLDKDVETHMKMERHKDE
tara:strand:+ start:81 stop:485 length:405 start_codon:yes stop_codon:yes gene_type:complete